jgi:hypothetical protein
LEIVVQIMTRSRDGKFMHGQGFTRRVSATGGLLDAPFRMELGQHFTVTNPCSKKEASCAVVQVRGPSQGFFSTAFEFSAVDPEFWPVNWSSSHKTLSPDLSKT